MPTIRVIKDKNYTVMSNYHLRDLNLSNKARGLLSTMLSLPPDWDYTVRGLSKICKDGVNSIIAQLQELEKYGYLERNKIRDEHGRVKDIEYCIYEQSQLRPDAPSAAATTDSAVPKAVKKSPPAAASKTVPKQDLPHQAGIPTPQAVTLPGVVTAEVLHLGNRDLENRDMGNQDMENQDMGNQDIGFQTQQNTRYNELLKEQNTVLNIDSLPSFPLPEQTAAKHPKKNQKRNERKRTREEEEELRRKAMKQLEEQEELRELVRDNVGLEDFEIMFPREYDREIACELVSLLEDTVCSCLSKPFIRISGENKPASAVKAQLLKVGYSHISTIVNNLLTNTTEIRNMRQYMLAALYNAPMTMQTQLTAQIQHDNLVYWQMKEAQEGNGSY